MNRKHGLLVLLAVMSSSHAVLADAPLKASTPRVLPGKVGHFDFMEVDGRNHRLLAAHKGAGALVIMDLKTGTPFPAISVGNVQGVAVDTSSDTYILGDADERKVVFVNAKTLRRLGELSVNGPVDAIAYNSKNGKAYAGEDDGSHLWVIDVKAQKLVSTIEIPGVPEFVVYEPQTDRIYQNIKTKNSVAIINPATNSVEAQWSTLPATEPHGLAVDSKTGHLFAAGHNGKLVMIDLKTGKIISQADIAPGTDQIAFDPGERIIYCASKGFISAVKETDKGLETLGDTPAPRGAHTLAVDAENHSVWISYADEKHSYLQRFTR